jgi:hypothetical protein
MAPFTPSVGNFPLTGVAACRTSPSPSPASTGPTASPRARSCPARRACRSTTAASSRCSARSPPTAEAHGDRHARDRDPRRRRNSATTRTRSARTRSRTADQRRRVRARLLLRRVPPDARHAARSVAAGRPRRLGPRRRAPDRQDRHGRLELGRRRDGRGRAWGEVRSSGRSRPTARRAPHRPQLPDAVLKGREREQEPLTMDPQVFATLERIAAEKDPAKKRASRSSPKWRWPPTSPTPPTSTTCKSCRST